MEHWTILNKTSYSGVHSGSILKQCQNPLKKTTLLAHQKNTNDYTCWFQEAPLGSIGLKKLVCSFWTIFAKHIISVVGTPKHNFAQC